jgi:hypothetical protein
MVSDGLCQQRSACPAGAPAKEVSAYPRVLVPSASTVTAQVILMV